MSEINLQDIETYYGILNHELETELRVIGAPQTKKERWFFQKEKLFEAIKKFNKKNDVYIGINERWIKGASREDVKSWNIVYIDAEGIGNKQAYKPEAFKLLSKAKEELFKQGINLIRVDSGGGYHGIIAFDKPVPIEKEEDRAEVEQWLARIKQWVKTYENPRAHFDPVVYDLPRIQRIPGTYNHKAQQLSFFIDTPAKTKIKNLTKWINSLPEAEYPEENKHNFNHNELTPKQCAFCEYALKNVLPSGERYRLLAPNMAAYVRNLRNKKELHAQFQRVQDAGNLGKNSLAEWDRVPSKFCCTALRHYAEKVKLGKICEECLEEEI